MLTARPLPRVALWLLAVAALLLHARYFWPYLTDDALISLRYAERFLHGQGLTWTAGRPVEGYSNLLWVLLVSVLGGCHVDLITAARVLGVAGMAVAAGLLVLADEETNGGLRPGVIVGLVFFAGAAPIAVWSIGGLEQPLVAACLAAAVYLTWRFERAESAEPRVAWLLSVPLGLLCLTRPDGPLFTPALLVALRLSAALDRRSWSWRLALRVAAFPALCVAGQLAFRRMYYGEWVPNTALVKLVPSVRHRHEALLYLKEGFMTLAPGSLLAVAALVSGLFDARRRRYVLPLLMLAVAWSTYLSVIGDIFPGYRHFAPLVVLFAFGLMEGANALPRRWLAAGPLLILIGVGISRQFSVPEVHRATSERWEWEGRLIALSLKDAFPDRKPVMAVTAAGSLPYWSGFDAIDLLGLNDYFLPRHPPGDLGSGSPGHELGSGQYLLDRSPDLVIFGLGDDPSYRTGDELRNIPRERDEFQRRYARVQLRVPEHNGLVTVFFNRESPITGIRRTPGKWVIPSYLLNGFEHAFAFVSGHHLVSTANVKRPLEGVFPGSEACTGASVAGENTELMQVALNAGRISVTTGSQRPLRVDSVELTGCPGQ